MPTARRPATDIEIEIEIEVKIVQRTQLRCTTLFRIPLLVRPALPAPVSSFWPPP
jgi:hypothetical protein